MSAPSLQISVPIGVQTSAHEAAWRIGALYGPLLLVLFAALWQRGRARMFAGCLLSAIAVLPSLLILERLNRACGWWTYVGAGPRFGGMPIELYLGWAVLWGLLPQIALRRLPVPGAAAAMAGLDLAGMPRLRPLVHLSPRWLTGEAVALLLVLLPALLIARWTEQRTHLRARAATQTILAGLLFLYMVPQIAFALLPGTAGWTALTRLPGPALQFVLATVFLLAIPGLAAIVEFAERGGGTPIPYDPPGRLVVSGVYRYCANPMQLSSGMVMLVWALALRSWPLLAAAALGIIYSAGLAEWDEAVDLEQRFGAEWRLYRISVRSWRCRWRPYCAEAKAHVYLARTCGPCSQLRAWIEARQPLGLEIADAESLPAGSIQRMRYVAEDGNTVEGVRALGRVLEHLDARLAFAGALLRLPGVWQGVQLLADTSGLGPRRVEADCPIYISKANRPTRRPGTSRLPLFRPGRLSAAPPPAPWSGPAVWLRAAPGTGRTPRSSPRSPLDP